MPLRDGGPAGGEAQGAGRKEGRKEGRKGERKEYGCGLLAIFQRISGPSDRNERSPARPENPFFLSSLCSLWPLRWIRKDRAISRRSACNVTPMCPASPHLPLKGARRFDGSSGSRADVETKLDVRGKRMPPRKISRG